MAAAADVAILERADAESRVVVSADTDFGTLVVLSARNLPSIILFRRDTNRTPRAQVTLLLNHLTALAESLENGCVVVFDQGRVRIRAL